VQKIKSHLSAILLFPVACLASSVSAIPDYFPPSQKEVIHAWLLNNSEYRIALDSDCDCVEDIDKMRRGYGGMWKANPNYHPYYASGDFNSDDKTDFAVVLVNNKENGKHYLAIFNGPSQAGDNPSFIREMRGALFFGEPRPKPHRLIIGDFESEGLSLEPQGSGYQTVDGIDYKPF
jgi:hypothetical protein